MNLSLETGADDSAALITRLASILSKTGYILPTVVIGLVVLASIYPDRLAFTRAHPNAVYVPPGTLPILGHTCEVVKLGTQHQFERFHEMTIKSPVQAFRLSFLGPGAMTMVNRPEYIEYIQKTNFENFVKGSSFRERFGDLLSTTGIFVADGDVWRSQRKMASHMFSTHQFNSHVRIVIHQELSRIDSLLEAVARSPQGQNTVNLPELFFRYTLSSFSKMAFSADLDCLSADPKCLERPVPFAVAFDFAQGVINERFVSPLWRILERFSEKGKRMRESIETIKAFGSSIIQQRLKSVQSNNDKTDDGKKKMGKDLLEFFIEQGLTDTNDLLVVVLNFIIAGRDTTAQALSWFFYEMMANPRHIGIIREECEAILGKDAILSQHYLKYEDFRKLPYTLACINETIRLHPPVPKNGKMVVRDDVLLPQGANPDNLPPIPVYKGEMVGWSDWVMNRLPQVWGEDAEEFRPERFLVRDEQAPVGWSYTQQSQWKFHAFNAGPRMCLGVNLAHYEALAFVAATLTKFDFYWASESQGQKSEWPPRYASSVTHPLKVPYLCTVTPRKD